MNQSQTKSQVLGHLSRHAFDKAMAYGANYAGVDEVGRGCIAGPVVAAAVIPPSDVGSWHEVNDSKRLSEKKRVLISEHIRSTARAYSIGIATPKEIDELNILRATQLAMGRAIAGLRTNVEIVLVDGNHPANTYISCIPVIKGDSRSLAIGAASILAKVYRDGYMKSLDADFPQYGFVNHVGYGTKQHIAALREFGPTVHHRMSFAPVQSSKSEQVRLIFNG